MWSRCPHKHAYWKGKIPEPLLGTLGNLFRRHDDAVTNDPDGLAHGMQDWDLHKYIAGLATEVFPDFVWDSWMSGRGSQSRSIAAHLGMLLDREWVEPKRNYRGAPGAT